MRHGLGRESMIKGEDVADHDKIKMGRKSRLYSQVKVIISVIVVARAVVLMVVSHMSPEGVSGAMASSWQTTRNFHYF